MTDLDTQSSLAVQPELVLGQGKPVQRRVEQFGVPITGTHSTRIHHDNYPILAHQIAPDVMRVCIGEPLTDSFAVLEKQEQNKRIDDVNHIEWSWMPNAHWQIAIHRHGQGIGTSRGLYEDSNGATHLYLTLPDQWPVYGLGEKTGTLNKQGKRYTFWNSDVFEPHTESTDALYQSIPFMVMSTDQGWMGLFVDNPGRLVFDLSLNDELCISADTGAIDLYVFSGESIADVLDAYTRLTGRPFLPPKWALGYHQSRHSYESERQVKDVVDGFTENDLPLDAIYLDIMYMDGYRVFSFNRDSYANAPELVDALGEQGIRVVPIVDPGIKVDKHYRVFQQGIAQDYFIETPEGDAWKGQVWPGESVWPDFFQKEVQTWWQDQHRYYTDMGIEGFWNDMNEPAVFNDRMTIDDDAIHFVDGQRVEHRAIHNAYGLQMSEATANALVEQCGTRPFVVTRAGYAGIQRSAVVWTGDNRSSWDHLRMSVPMILNLGLSGVVLSGADIGGFMDDTNPELLTRWLQLGCFYPFMRNHCSIGQVAQEPWAFGEEWTSINRKAMHRRYKLLPYLYQLMRDAHETGVPLWRPMFWSDMDRANQNKSDQFFVGDDVLIAPITEPSIAARAVSLPVGEWYSLQDQALLHGQQAVLAQTGIEDIPIYLRAGAILPVAPYRSTTAKPLRELRLLIVDGRDDGRILYRDDDGVTADPMENRYARLSFGYHRHNGHVECHLSLDRSHYQPNWQQITLGVPKEWKSKEITLNAESMTGIVSVDGVRVRLKFVEPADWL